MFRVRSKPQPSDDDRRFVSSGRVVRFVYGTVVVGILLFMIFWVSRPLIFLEGPGTVEASALEISVPYMVTVKVVEVKPGQVVSAGAIVAVVSRADAQDVLRLLSQRLHDARRKETEMRGRLIVATETVESLKKRVKVAGDSVERVQSHKRELSNSAELSSIYREFAEASDEKAKAEADISLMPKAIADTEREIEEITKEIGQIEKGWGHIELKAPHTGTIGAKVVQAGSTVSAGGALMTLFETSRLTVSWHLPAFSLVMPSEGDAVSVSYGHHNIKGITKRVLPVADAPAGGNSARGRLVEVELPEGESNVPLGAEVVVRLHYF